MNPSKQLDQQRGGPWPTAICSRWSSIPGLATRTWLGSTGWCWCLHCCSLCFQNRYNITSTSIFLHYTIYIICSFMIHTYMSYSGSFYIYAHTCTPEISFSLSSHSLRAWKAAPVANGSQSTVDSIGKDIPDRWKKLNVENPPCAASIDFFVICASRKDSFHINEQCQNDHK